ncbi:MAG: flavoprotein [Bacteroidetes bacterium]|nr:MAG: flavoprotein [Bacteroidota bacterium]
MLAAMLDPALFAVHIFEKNAAPARKFLVAGDGGLNLSHAEPVDDFISRYTPAEFIEPFIRKFDADSLRNWFDACGISTYVGSSLRIFPGREIKPVEVLQAMLQRVQDRGVTMHLKHHWKGWKENELLFETANESVCFAADITVLALGGASWPVTGTDGAWTNILAGKGISIRPFEASNCAVITDWPETFINEHEGAVLKGVMLKCGNRARKGDVVIKRNGMEGGPVYFLSPEIRSALKNHGEAMITADLQPARETEEIKQALETTGRRSNSEILKRLGLGPVARGMLRQLVDRDTYDDPGKLAAAVKAFPFRIVALGPVEDAISTVGGIPTEEVDQNLELKKLPGCFAMGEMLDWDAPTGGYLLQACFSMGYTLAAALNERYAAGE